MKTTATQEKKKPNVKPRLRVKNKPKQPSLGNRRKLALTNKAWISKMERFAEMIACKEETKTTQKQIFELLLLLADKQLIGANALQMLFDAVSFKGKSPLRPREILSLCFTAQETKPQHQMETIEPLFRIASFLMNKT